MNLEAGEITGRQVAKNMDSETETQILQVQLTEDEDVQNPEEMHIPNFQYRPETGVRAFVARVTAAWKTCVGIDDKVTKVALNGGEFYLYSVSGGLVKANIKGVNDGILEINGSTDFAVAFNDLKIAFNQLQSDHDALLNEYKLHVHTGVTTGAGSTSAAGSALSPSSADIDPAKVATVKLP